LERTKEALADAIEKHLVDCSTNRQTVQCKTEDEAILLAHEMKKRGWRAEATTSFAMVDGELSPADVVRIHGRKRARHA
jgi:hypothetical protein